MAARVRTEFKSEALQPEQTLWCAGNNCGPCSLEVLHEAVQKYSKPIEAGVYERAAQGNQMRGPIKASEALKQHLSTRYMIPDPSPGLKKIKSEPSTISAYVFVYENILI